MHSTFQRFAFFHRLIGIIALAVFLSACAQHRATKNTSLTNTYWKLVTLAGKSVVLTADEQTEPHFILHDGAPARLSGSGGCNRLMGSYRIEAQQILFDKVAMTMMACAQGMDTEHAFTAWLEGAKEWRIEGQTLILKDAQRHTEARFVAVYLR